jgi:hypothetical protein
MPELCKNCEKEFTPVRPNQRFCSNGGKCRNEWHARQNIRDGIPVRIAAARTLKRGQRSITLHISADQADRLAVHSLAPGMLARLVLDPGS